LRIAKLKIENLRNIKNAEIYPGNRLNIFIGENGAGKTTLLESIYLLARARSFRTNQNKHLISQNEKELIIYTEIENDNGTQTKIGLSKQKQKTQIKCNGQQVSKLSQLASAIPLTIITPNIQRVIEEGPVHRRKLLNWGMFHVEQSYGQLFLRYKKTLNQRNRALTAKSQDVRIWSRKLSELGEEINKLQEKYLKEWNNALLLLEKENQTKLGYKLELSKGWRNDISLQDALDEYLLSDQERGYTTPGPHRLDIKIVKDGDNIKTSCSRGQNKLVAINIMLAQTLMMTSRSKENPLLLIDDLHSELDNKNYHDMIDLISKLKIQTFVTSLNESIMDQKIDVGLFQMFHVEHGVVKNV
jgi:DNA replication and repair protein RecF